ncbi:MAG: hypothetical protein ACREV5_11370 [Steroidobacter sp.]
MDRKYIDDNHIVARYLADNLPDNEREAFEAYYLEHPEIVQEMEAAARFKVGLMQLRDAGELDALMKPQPWYREQRSLAAAAVAVVAVGLSFFLLRSPSMQPMLVASPRALINRLGDPLPIASTHAILRTRGISYDAEIDLPQSAQTIELRVLPEYEAQPPRYRIVLSSIADDDSLQQLAEVDGLAPDEDGFVPVFLNGAKVERGRYQVMLSGDEGTSAVQDASVFLIRIREADETSLH